MSNIDDVSSGIDYITSDLNYIVSDGKLSIRYIDWPEEAHNEHILPYEQKATTIYNGRIAKEPFSLDSHGFNLVQRGTKVIDFYNEEEIKRVYYPETKQIILDQSGARQVYVFDHTIRTPTDTKHKDGWIRSPVRYVHNDYTETSAPQRVKDFFPEAADKLMKRRFAIIQTWRSIGPKIESEPLALCDGRTIPEIGFIRNQRRYRDRTAETYHIAYNAAHRWYYFPFMQRSEALIFKVYDSDPDVNVRFTAHSAINDPNSPSNAKPRESIEMRALAFF